MDWVPKVEAIRVLAGCRTSDAEASTAEPHPRCRPARWGGSTGIGPYHGPGVSGRLHGKCAVRTPRTVRDGHSSADLIPAITNQFNNQSNDSLYECIGDYSVPVSRSLSSCCELGRQLPSFARVIVEEELIDGLIDCCHLVAKARDLLRLDQLRVQNTSMEY
ncbi:uncharacterized protein BO96DRAFT_346062 [Aspergillus niger CBS 101883]|uniref:Uncharacterized protein n=2 Tax=Aspergillus niger TaxID=5061 RepID=A2QHN0_ASPNC|nr:uncharacterized protein BO96DRAFT_346062 [Aspergillus niger CBS 101883]XP_059600428.1 hypothetical protein An04g00440 [Aspergillus niger]PYH53141.1 hypothetical protein BO96DRAFT_346062 [Aspergillus niger CBS 101883]CAK38500.1 hypothetical protein An04g00440 [Aspergillus niger]